MTFRGSSSCKLPLGGLLEWDIHNIERLGGGLSAVCTQHCQESQKHTKIYLPVYESSFWLPYVVLSTRELALHHFCVVFGDFLRAHSSRDFIASLLCNIFSL